MSRNSVSAVLPWDIDLSASFQCHYKSRDERVKCLHRKLSIDTKPIRMMMLMIKRRRKQSNQNNAKWNSIWKFTCHSSLALSNFRIYVHHTENSQFGAHSEKKRRFLLSKMFQMVIKCIEQSSSSRWIGGRRKVKCGPIFSACIYTFIHTVLYISLQITCVASSPLLFFRVRLRFGIVSTSHWVALFFSIPLILSHFSLLKATSFQPFAHNWMMKEKFNSLVAIDISTIGWDMWKSIRCRRFGSLDNTKNEKDNFSIWTFQGK